MALTCFRRRTCQHVILVFLSCVATSERHIDSHVLGVETQAGLGAEGETDEDYVDMAHQEPCETCKEGDMVVIEEWTWTWQEKEAWEQQIEQKQFTEAKFGRELKLGQGERQTIMPEKLEFRPWPDATIKYCYDANIDDKARQVLEDGMAEWAARTCIRFEQWCPDDKLGTVTFQSNERGCWAYAGYYSNHAMKLNLGPGCHSQGIAMHELGHTIGFHHEHSRPDRDDYVTILWDNINRKKHDQFVKKKEVLTGGYKYDLASIMHYTKKAFSEDGSITIQMVGQEDSWGNCDFGQRHFLSRGDILSANAGYGCDKRSNIEFCVDLVDNCAGFSQYCPNEGLESVEELTEFGTMFQTDVSMQLKMLVLCRSTCEICNCQDNDEVDCQNKMNSIEGYMRCDPRKGTGEPNTEFDYMKSTCRKSCGFCTGKGAEVCKEHPKDFIIPFRSESPMSNVRYTCPQIRTRIYLCDRDSFLRRTCPLECGRCPTEPYCPTAVRPNSTFHQRQLPRTVRELM